MRFDLVDLQLFVAVADFGSITHGAARANLALASASARIKGLEADLGVSLVRRRRRGIELTAAGESLRDHARAIMHQVAMMQGDIAAFSSGVRASVHLLANTSGLSEYLPKALGSFLREYPDISLDVEERESADIVGAIAGGAADLGFAAEHAIPAHFERFSFGEDRLMLVAPKRSEFSSRRQIDFIEVTDCDFVGLTNTTALAIHIGRHAARLGVRLRLTGEVTGFRCDLPHGGGRCRHRGCAGGGGAPLHAIDADCVDRDPRRLGQSQACDLRPQLQEPAEAGEASRRPPAQGGAIILTSRW